jgi:hypothetical protein
MYQRYIFKEELAYYYTMAYDLAPLEKYMNETINDLVKRICTDFSIDLEEVIKKYNINQPPKPPAKKKPSTPRKKVTNEFVEMSEFDYDDTKYLIDKNNNIYTYDVEKPCLVGQKLVNGAVKFVEK